MTRNGFGLMEAVLYDRLFSHGRSPGGIRESLDIVRKNGL